jgi:hypothetical protein
VVPIVSALIARAFRRTAVPLAFYYGVTVALPIANGAVGVGAPFVEHALVVLVTPPILIALACTAIEVVRRCLPRIQVPTTSVVSRRRSSLLLNR